MLLCRVAWIDKNNLLIDKIKEILYSYSKRPASFILELIICKEKIHNP